MKKVVLSVVLAAGLVSTTALAADMPMKAPPAPPAAPTPTWDVAFGTALMTDYNFRGITQSDHKPSVAGYFEPRYNINSNLQLYAGMSGESIEFPNRAAAEVDFYGGIRPTFDKLALDAGLWYYYYPDGTCYNGAVAGCQPSLINGNVIKADLSFWEVYGKATYTFNDNFSAGISTYYSPSVLNSGASGWYTSGNVKFTVQAPGLQPAGVVTPPAISATGSSVPATHSMASRASPAAFRTRAIGIGTPASASPTRCSRSICVTMAPI